MARAIRFHLDENCDPRIAAGLALHGVEATTTRQAGLLHASDEAHVAYALAQGRVIVTHDPDFLRAAADKTQSIPRITPVARRVVALALAFVPARIRLRGC